QWSVCRKRSPYPKMNIGALYFRNQRVRRFVNAVVSEPVCTLGPEYEAGLLGMLQIAIEFLFAALVDRCEYGSVGAVAETGQMAQRTLSVGRQAMQLADHQVDDIVRVPLRMNASQVPGPVGLALLEREQSFLDQRGKKLNDEEWIAAGLLMHQFRQRGRALVVTVERIRNQLPHVFVAERCENHLLHRCSGASDLIHAAHQRMG